MARGDHGKAQKHLLYGTRRPPQPRSNKPRRRRFLSGEEVLHLMTGLEDHDIRLGSSVLALPVPLHVAGHAAMLAEDGHQRAILRLTSGGRQELELMRQGQLSELRQALGHLLHLGCGDILWEYDMEPGTTAESLIEIMPAEHWHLLSHAYSEDRSERQLLSDLLDLDGDSLGEILADPQRAPAIQGPVLDLAVSLDAFLETLPEQ